MLWCNQSNVEIVSYHKLCLQRAVYSRNATKHKYLWLAITLFAHVFSDNSRNYSQQPACVTIASHNNNNNYKPSASPVSSQQAHHSIFQYWPDVLKIAKPSLNHLGLFKHLFSFLICLFTGQRNTCYKLCPLSCSLFSAGQYVFYQQHITHMGANYCCILP